MTDQDFNVKKRTESNIPSENTFGYTNVEKDSFFKKVANRPVEDIYNTQLPTTPSSATKVIFDTIVGHEGFRKNAYWDVNHFRVGYGSDTKTFENGKVAEVTQNTSVTKQDADRDLLRRIGEYEKKVINQIGSSAYQSYDVKAQAALISIAYNYGSLPKNIASAAQTKNPNILADAVLSRKGDDDGVNSGRRTLEAADIRNSNKTSDNLNISNRPQDRLPQSPDWNSQSSFTTNQDFYSPLLSKPKIEVTLPKTEDSNDPLPPEPSK